MLWALLRAYLEITKPRLVWLVLWTVAIGFFLASHEKPDGFLFANLMLGTALVSAGSMALNQYLEKDIDACMKRTESRPLPSRRLEPSRVLLIGTVFSILGVVFLSWRVNFITAFLALVTLVTYLFIYTPLKTRTPWCTLAGAVPGAIPPIMGWTAVRGRIEPEAWILFSILFVWQLPHFYAIAWVCRADYAKAGLKMLSVVDPTGKRVGSQIMGCTLGVFLLSFLPAFAGMTGSFYYLAAFLLGIWLILSSFRTAFQLDRLSRSYFRNSIIYLTLLFLLLVLDRSRI